MISCAIMSENAFPAVIYITFEGSLCEELSIKSAKSVPMRDFPNLVN